MNKKKIKHLGGGKVSYTISESVKPSSTTPSGKFNKKELDKLRRENLELRETIEILFDKKVMERFRDKPTGPNKSLKEVLKKYGYA